MTTAPHTLSSKLASPWRLLAVPRLFARLGIRQSSADDDFADLLQQTVDGIDAAETDLAATEGNSADEPQVHWGKWRIDLMERLWGKGFLLPGGTEFVSELTKPLNLGPKASVLVLGAGMGGPSNLIAQDFGAFVDAVEPDPELATASSQRAAVVKGISRVTINNLAIDNDDAFTRKYDAIFGQEILLQLADGPELLMRCAKALKKNGKLVITDFTRAEETDEAVTAAWLKRENAVSSAHTEAELRALFENAGFRMRTVEDMTDRYVGLVLNGWVAFEESLRENAADRDTILGMVAEAERWALRVTLLKNDQIQYTRMFGTKKTKL